MESPPQTEQNEDANPIPSVVKTIDGEEIERDEARRMSRRFLLLPWMWVMNVWLFWPVFQEGSDAVIQAYTRKSAIGAAIMTVVFLPWMLAYLIGGETLFGDEFFHKLDASRLNLD